MEDLKKKYGDTAVYVVNNDAIGTKNFKDSFRPVLQQFEEAIDEQFNEIGFFTPRYEAEVNQDLRQVIPYCLIKFEDYYFVTKRLAGDSRLIGKTSCGIGGHIEIPEQLTNHPIWVSLYRELYEELDLGLGEETVTKITLSGIIKSDATEVDKVHLGLVYVIEVCTWDITIKETDILEGIWVYKEDLKEYSDNWETWSQICIEKVV